MDENNYEQIKNELCNFISKSLTPTQIKKLKKENPNKTEEHFSTHTKFMSENKKIIIEFNNYDTIFYRDLMNMILTKELVLLDQENFEEKEASGFYFNPNREVVILWNE